MWEVAVDPVARQAAFVYTAFTTKWARVAPMNHSRAPLAGITRGFTPAAAFFAFLFAQPNFTPLTGTTSEQHMADDLGALDVALSGEEQRQIAAALYS